MAVTARGAMRKNEVLFMHAGEREGERERERERKRRRERWFPGSGMASLNGRFQTGRGRLKLERQKEGEGKNVRRKERMMCRRVFL